MNHHANDDENREGRTPENWLSSLARVYGSWHLGITAVPPPAPAPEPDSAGGANIALIAIIAIAVIAAIGGGAYFTLRGCV